MSILSDEIPGNVEQPVGVGGLICCKNRILTVLKRLGGNAKNYLGIISIENAIEHIPDRGQWDMAHIMIYDPNTGIYYYSNGGRTHFDQVYFDLAKQKSNVTALGWSYTVGEAMRDCRVVKNEKNWMAEIPCSKTGQFVDRHTQIASVYGRLLNRYKLKRLATTDIFANVGYDLNFKSGVIFQDLGPIMASRPLFDLFMYECISYLGARGVDKVDYVVGIGVRGFYMAPLLAQHFGAGFIPIRKKGKIPGNTVCREYTTEYSTNEMEIQPDLIPIKYDTPSTVLIVDDLVATGGSLVSAVKLMHDAYGPSHIKVVGCFCPLSVKGMTDTAYNRLEKEVNTKLFIPW
jgi:adenine phosphoribosyltransferase